MSAFDNVVVGKLKLKGTPLDVKGGGGITKKKKKHVSKYYHQLSQRSQGGEAVVQDVETYYGGGQPGMVSDEHLTLAERRYLEQSQRIELERLAKTARRSRRDRVQEFNQYLANLSEHFDIPKVGPG